MPASGESPTTRIKERHKRILLKITRFCPSWDHEQTRVRGTFEGHGARSCGACGHARESARVPEEGRFAHGSRRIDGAVSACELSASPLKLICSRIPRLRPPGRRESDRWRSIYCQRERLRLAWFRHLLLGSEPTARIGVRHSTSEMAEREGKRDQGALCRAPTILKRRRL